MGQTSTHHNARVGGYKFLFGIFTAFLLLPFLAQSQVTASITGTNITCYGLCNGSATATGSGGWAPYTFHWSNGATTATITGLCAGTYQVTVTDIDLGFGVASITITQPTQLGVTVNATQQQLCGVAPDGQASVVPFGGTPPYTYLWNTGATTPLITGLPQGTYSVTVTDANGCTAAGSTAITYSPEGIWVIDSSEDVTCFGANNGFIHVGAMTGTPPYTFQWSNGATGQDIFNLAPGNYTVTTTDHNGCTNLHTVVITQPPALVVGMTMTDALCGLPGSATVIPSGGTPPYSVLWSNNSTNFTISVFPGNYSVTVTDANACTAVKQLTVGGTTAGLTVNVTLVTNAGCTIGGSATATATGGTGNYAYSWDNGQTTATATNLSANVLHHVTVTDITTGCSGVGSITVPSATTLGATTVLNANATCLVGGSATAVVTGGTPPYTYLWSNGQTGATATGLPSGTVGVTVTDALGCKATATVSIGQSQGPNVTITINSSATCTGGGSATAVATGTGPYTYLWSNGQTTATATNLPVGTASVTVTDQSGCAGSAMTTITVTGAPTAIISASSGAACTTGGSATAGATGGTAPYTFKWSNGAITATVTNLSAGSYTVTVTDAAGCTGTATVSIAGALPPNVVITASSNAKCDQPGSAKASATNGSGPYTYKWSNGETTATAVNLAAGIYTVTVTDAAGCTGTATVTIGFAANGIKIGDFVWYDVSQNGLQDPLETGVANVTVMLLKSGPDGIFGTADDVILQTTTTNSNGKYEFGCITPGTYVVMFSGIPSGYQFTAKDYVNNDCLDSDAKTNGKTDPFTIVAGQGDNLCIDAGITTVCDNVLNAGIVCCNQTICEGDVPAALVPVQAPSGGSGAIEYQWLQLIQVGPAPANWTPIPGATAATYQPGPLTVTSFFMRCARRAGCVAFLESNIITITVKPSGTPGCTSFITQINAFQQGPTSVFVNWETLPEADDYMYTVEHSMNQTVWNSIGTVMGKHDAIQHNSYSLLDKTPENGLNYYRVKRANVNGIESFSSAVSVDLKLQGEAALMITPNPVVDKLYIKNVASYTSDVTIQLFSTQGKLLKSMVIKQGTLQQTEITMTDLPQGIYMVRANFGDGNVKTLKITKM